MAERVALPFPPYPLRPAGEVGAVGVASASAPRSAAARAPSRSAASSSSEAKGIRAERSMRGGAGAGEPGLQPRAAGVEGQRAQVLARRRTGGRRAARRPGSRRATSAPTVLRLRRCWRSAKGATAPSRTTSSSPSSTASKSMAARISGKAARDVLAAAGAEPRGRRAWRRVARGCRPISIRRAGRRGRGRAGPRVPADAPASAGGRPGRSRGSGRAARPSSQAKSGR